MPMINPDRITKIIQEKLSSVKKLDFNSAKSKLLVEVKEIYKTANIKDIIDRKYYLENCIDSPYVIFTSLTFSIIVWFITDSLTQLFNSTDASEIVDKNIAMIKITIFAILLVLLLVWLLTKESRLYLQYNLKDVELQIIDKILEKEYNYNGIVEDILISRDRSSRDETEIQDAELPNSGS